MQNRDALREVVTRFHLVIPTGLPCWRLILGGGWPELVAAQGLPAGGKDVRRRSVWVGIAAQPRAWDCSGRGGLIAAGRTAGDHACTPGFAHVPVTRSVLEACPHLQVEGQPAEKACQRLFAPASSSWFGVCGLFC